MSGQGDSSIYKEDIVVIFKNENAITDSDDDFHPSNPFHPPSPQSEIQTKSESLILKIP